MLAVERGLAWSQDVDGSSSFAAVNYAMVRDVPKDCEYMYDLCARLERLRAQKSENPRFRKILAENDMLFNSGRNLIQGPGVEALFEAISNKNSWKYLRPCMQWRAFV